MQVFSSFFENVFLNLDYNLPILKLARGFYNSMSGIINTDLEVSDAYHSRGC